MSELKYVKTGKITIEKLQVIRKYNLQLSTKDGYAENLFDVLTDPVALKEVCGAIFDDDFKNVDANDIDVSKVHDGVQSFLPLLWWRSSGSTTSKDS